MLAALALAVSGCECAPAAGLDGSVSDGGERDAASLADVGLTDGAVGTDANTSADGGARDAGPRTVSAVGGFSTSGAMVRSTRFAVVDHGFATSSPSCGAGLCVYGGFRR